MPITAQQLDQWECISNAAGQSQGGAVVVAGTLFTTWNDVSQQSIYSLSPSLMDAFAPVPGTSTQGIAANSSKVIVGQQVDDEISIHMLDTATDVVSLVSDESLQSCVACLCLAADDDSAYAIVNWKDGASSSRRLVRHPLP